MSALPVPDLMAENIYALTPELFRERGVRLLLLDLDNTLAPYSAREAPDALRQWVRRMAEAGLTLRILSNNRGTRPETFAAALGVPYRKNAKKPRTAAALAVMAEAGVTPAETAFIGDQIFTDVLCARRCGASAVLVRPMEFTYFWLRLRYRAETPFRILYKCKRRKTP